MCDVLLLVATQSEQDALAKAAAELDMPFESRTWSSLGEYFDLGTVGADRVFAVRTRMGAVPHEGSAYKATMFRHATGATAIIQTGMAFGVDPVIQKLGDVLIASSIIPYDERDVLSDGEGWRFDYDRAKRRHAKKPLVTLLQREAARGDHPFAVHVGAVLSGGARIFCGGYRDELVRTLPPGRDRIVGGEMEGVGLLSVSPAAQPLWVVVKGISDFADADRDGIIFRTRPIACENAARFVLSALKRNLT